MLRVAVKKSRQIREIQGSGQQETGLESISDLFQELFLCILKIGQSSKHKAVIFMVPVLIDRTRLPSLQASSLNQLRYKPYLLK